MTIGCSLLPQQNRVYYFAHSRTNNSLFYEPLPKWLLRVRQTFWDFNRKLNSRTKFSDFQPFLAELFLSANVTQFNNNLQFNVI